MNLFQSHNTKQNENPTSTLHIILIILHNFGTNVHEYAFAYFQRQRQVYAKQTEMLSVHQSQSVRQHNAHWKAKEEGLMRVIC